MNLNDVMNIGTQLLKQWRFYNKSPTLFDEGWRFVIDQGPTSRRLGQCRYAKKEIGITAWYASSSKDAIVLDTIKHEIAHALSGPYEGHGPKWKWWCRRVGANPKRTKDESDISTNAPFIATCLKCGRIFGKTKRPKPSSRYWCKCQTRTSDAKRVYLEFRPNVERVPKIKERVAAQHVDKPESSSEIARLLDMLVSAHTKNEGKSIRAKLRRLGHRGGLN